MLNNLVKKNKTATGKSFPPQFRINKFLCAQLFDLHVGITFEESVEQSNLLLKVAVRCVLQLGALEVLARVENVFNFVESSILVHQEQQRLQTLEGGGGATSLQDEAPL